LLGRNRGRYSSLEFSLDYRVRIDVGDPALRGWNLYPAEAPAILCGQEVFPLFEGGFGSGEAVASPDPDDALGFVHEA
jgi:hypothetical protein